MSSEGLTEPVKRGGGRFKLVFIVAFALTVATYSLGFGISIYFQQFFQSSFLNGGANLIEVYNLVESIIGFVFNPVICFLIFYKIGSRISIQTFSDHVRLLTSSFAGGLTGYGVGYLFLIAYELIAYHSFNVAGPNTDWFLWSASFTVQFLRGGVAVAFLAFTGIVIGGFRSHRTSVTATSVESTTPPFGGSDPA
ncbi:MAG: hypothetical protein OK452_01945 [Thaumarchaeota archaeon]|nr:hypothetical protein [Nitrososphaerota archaeon]